MNLMHVAVALLQILVLSSAVFAQSPPPSQANAGVAPHTFSIFRGIEVASDLSNFADSDDVRAQFRPGFILNGGCAPVWLIFDGLAPDTTQFLIESRAGTPGLRYTVEAWDWSFNRYDVLGSQTESFAIDQVVLFDLDAEHVDFVGNVRGRVGWRRVGFTIKFPWMVEIDQFAFCPPQ